MKKIYLLTLLLSPILALSQSTAIEQGYTSFEILPSGIRTMNGTSSINTNVTLGYDNNNPFVLNANDNVKFGISNFINNFQGDQNIAIGTASLRESSTGINNIAIGYRNLAMISSDSSNIAIGMENLSNLSDGSLNIALGYKNMTMTTGGSGNIALGESNFLNTATNGDDNIAFGSSNLVDNEGYENIALGNASLHENSSGYKNIALGRSSMFLNDTGNQNIAIGNFSLSRNTTGSKNIALGQEAQFNNISGNSNIAFGNRALYQNLSSENIGIGRSALAGLNNPNVRSTAIGVLSQIDGTSGKDNLSIGYWALSFNTTGTRNQAFGAYALQENQADDNIGIGNDAGKSHVTGDGNIFIGAFSNDNSANKNVSNSAAIGYGTLVSSNNTYQLGNISVSSIGGYANWSNFSDRRLKKNIEYADELGLAFIKELKTATYQYKKDPTDRVLNGLIAQDVQSTLAKLDVAWSGLIELDDEDRTLAIAYGQLTIPLINATKELKERYDALQAKLELINAENKKLEELSVAYENLLDKEKDTTK